MLSESLKSSFMPQEAVNLGSDNPEIYVLVDVPSFLNIKAESPLLKDTYQILVNSLIKNRVFRDEREILDTIAISTSLKYCPKDSIVTYKSRKPNTLDIRNLRHLNYEEIENYNPKVIVASGQDAIKIITDFKYSSYKEVEKIINYKYKGIPVVFTPSIDNIAITRSGSFLRKEFNFISGCFLKALKLAKGIEPKHPLDGLNGLI